MARFGLLVTLIFGLVCGDKLVKEYFVDEGCKHSLNKTEFEFECERSHISNDGTFIGREYRCSFSRGTIYEYYNCLMYDYYYSRRFIENVKADSCDSCDLMTYDAGECYQELDSPGLWFTFDCGKYPYTEVILIIVFTAVVLCVVCTCICCFLWSAVGGGGGVVAVGAAGGGGCCFCFSDLQEVDSDSEDCSEDEFEEGFPQERTFGYNDNVNTQPRVLTEGTSSIQSMNQSSSPLNIGPVQPQSQSHIRNLNILPPVQSSVTTEQVSEDVERGEREFTNLEHEYIQQLEVIDNMGPQQQQRRGKNEIVY